MPLVAKLVYAFFFRPHMLAHFGFGQRSWPSNKKNFKTNTVFFFFLVMDAGSKNVHMVGLPCYLNGAVRMN